MFNWRKGALHTHTYWSDGEAFPEQMVQAYRMRGFDFVCWTDHNIFAEDPQLWLRVYQLAGGWPRSVNLESWKNYCCNFPDMIEQKQIGFKTFARCKTFAEIQQQLQEDGNFLILPGIELTGYLEQASNPRTDEIELTAGYEPQVSSPRTEIHMLSLNTQCQYTYMHGRDNIETIRLNKDQFDRATQAQTNPGMFIFCHPFWRYLDNLPDTLLQNSDVRHFEICNCDCLLEEIPKFVTLGKFWDIVNAFRAEDGIPLLFATAVDDAHNYGASLIDSTLGGCNAAFVMVDVGEDFSANSVINAMNRGDYYASNGLLLETIEFDGKTLRVKAQVEKGIDYQINFITTKCKFDRSFEKVEWSVNKVYSFLPKYSDDIGKTSKTVMYPEAEYTLAKDDLYVRAEIISNIPVTRSHYILGKDLILFPKYKKAWTQPFLPRH